jgi:hypothetical protein
LQIFVFLDDYALLDSPFADGSFEAVQIIVIMYDIKEGDRLCPAAALAVCL